MRKLLVFAALLVAFSSCKVFRSNLMLKTPQDFVYDTLVDSLSRLDYRIARNDLIVYRLVPNNGFKLLDIVEAPNSIYRNDIEVTVESDDSVKMPLIGRVKLAGLTLKEAEVMLEDSFSVHYVQPFVTLRVTNKRVIIFPGNGGQAKVLPMANNNTTVLEAIASAGGILEDGKAYKVKLIRKNPVPSAKPFVYLMDLSRIEGITMGNSIVQAGDIIYVEPRYRPFATFTKEISPILTLVTSAFIIYQLSVIITR